MYQVLSSTVVFFVSYMHVLLEVVCCCFSRKNILLNMTMFVRSQSFISVPSFMFVSALVGEICRSRTRRRRILKLAVSSLTPNILPIF